jgi:hypothetical protein
MLLLVVGLVVGLVVADVRDLMAAKGQRARP